MSSPNSTATSPYGNFPNYVQDEQQFGRPLLGGSVAVMYNTITFEDTDDTDLFTLPTGAVILQWLVNVTTAFDDSGTDLLDIGGAASNTYANDLDVAATGQITAGYVPSQILAAPLSEPVTVTGKYIGQNGNATEGEAVVCVFYALMGGQS